MSLTVNSIIFVLSSLLGGSLLVPAARKVLLGNIDHDWLADELEADHVHNGLLTMKNDTYCAVFQLEGQPYDTRPISQAQVDLDRRAQNLFELGQGGTNLTFFGSKRLKPVNDKFVFTDPVLSMIQDKEANQHQQIFKVVWLLCLQNKSSVALNRHANVVMTGFSDYKPRRLLSNDKDCELSAFFEFCLSGRLEPSLPRYSSSISANIGYSSIHLDKDTGVITTKTPDPHLYQAVAVMTWPEELSGEFIHDIISLPISMDVYQRVLPQDTAKSKLLIERRKREISSAILGSKESELDQLEDVEKELGTDKICICNTEFTIFIQGREKKELDDNIRLLSETLRKKRVLHSVEVGAAGELWFARQPGRTQLVRPLKLLNDNVASLWPFEKSPSGLADSPWGKGPVRRFRTMSGENYSFNFHVSSAPQSKGHFLVFAPTGAGKSTLIMHLLGGLARHEGVNSYILDSHEGARYMIEAMGGDYMSLNDLKLNALDVGSDNPTARQRVLLMLQAMVGSEWKSEYLEEASHALESVFMVDVPQRTLSNVFATAFSKGSPLRNLLLPWVETRQGNKGVYSHVFNHAQDTMTQITKETHLLGLNMTEALKDPALTGPIIAHITEAVRSNAAESTTNGFVVFIDEAAHLLSSPSFAALAKVMFREYRKLNGVVGLAFQDPTALTKTDHADALIENAACMFFWPNPTSNIDAFKQFHLNDEQLAFIKNGSARQVLLVKRDAAIGLDESTILNVDLSYLGGALNFYRSGKEAMRDLQNARTQHPETWWEQIS